MTYVDIDTQIKNYRARAERTIPDNVLVRFKDIYTDFSDATKNNTVDAAELLHHLDLGFLEQYLASLYSRKPEYPPLAMLKSLFLMDLKKMKFFTQLTRFLRNDIHSARLMGFTIKNGVADIPSSKTFWHFYNIRLRDLWSELFILLRDRVVLEAKANSVNLGQDTAQDAIPIPALPGDKDAQYNDHYKIKGYKLDNITDIHNGIPFSVQTTDINNDEAKNLIPMTQEMLKSGIHVKNRWIDGGYDDYTNLAWLGINKIQAHHRIHENWVYNPSGDIEHILKIYQKHWNDFGFKPNACTEYILGFLFEKGYVLEVGAFFRNISMSNYQNNPNGYLKDYHLRSRKEGNHGYWNEHLCLKDRLRVKGRVKVDRYLTRNFCTILAVALCRLQHGVKQNLTSVVYLT